MMINVKVTGETNLNRLNYVLQQIMEHPRSPKNMQFVINSKEIAQRILYYGSGDKENVNDDHDQFIIPKANCFFGATRVPNDRLSINSYKFKEGEVYAVELIKSKGLSFCDHRYFGFDIFESLFFYWSRYEEWVYEREQDYKGMMPENEQLLVRHSLEKTPVLDLLIEAFWEALKLECETYKTQIILTHDIDHLRKFKEKSDYLKKKLGQIKRGEFKGLRELKQQVKEHKTEGKDPYDVYDWMLEADKSNAGFIYYLVGGSTKYDTPIDTSDEMFLESIDLSKQRNYKIGIHPSFEAAVNRSVFREEKVGLEKITRTKIFQSRNHYLRFVWPATLDILEQEDIMVDSSLAFAERIGFRCGTGFSYRLYHFEQDRSSNVYESPLVFMDSALIKEGKGKKEVMNKLFTQFWEKNKNRTRLVFNFHNNRFEESDRNDFGLRSLYDKVRREA